MTSNTSDSMTKDQALALVTCMLAIAHVDGVRPEELALIRRFHEESSDLGLPAFDALVAAPADPLPLLSALKVDAAFAEQLVSMCIMTGYADGDFSEAERVRVGALAARVGIEGDAFAALHQSVKDSLIGSLAHLPDAASVAALVKPL
jgi:uncharacterized tellurite resistance protein B-like protein